MAHRKQPEPEIGGAWGALSLRGARVANGVSMNTSKSGLRAPSPPSKQDRSNSSPTPPPPRATPFESTTSSSPLSNTMRSYFQAMSSEQLTQREEEAARSVASPYSQQERNDGYVGSVTPSLNMTYASQQYYTPMSPTFADQQLQQQQQQPSVTRKVSPQKFPVSTSQRGKTSYARATPPSQQDSRTTLPVSLSPSSPLPPQQQRLPWVNGPLGPYCVLHSQSVLTGPCSECLNPTQKLAPMPLPTPEPINTRPTPLSPLEASALLVGVAGLSLNHVLMRLSRKANEVGKISRAGLVSVLDHAQRIYSQTHSFDKRLSSINLAAAPVLVLRLWRTLSIISNAEDASAFKHSGVGESDDDTIDYQIVLTAMSPLLSGTRDDKLRVIFSNASEDHHVNSTARLMRSSPRLNRRQVARLLTHVFAGLKVFETVDEALYAGGQASRAVSEAKLARDATSQAVSITDKVLTAVENNELSEEAESTPQMTADLARGLGVKPKSSSCSHRELDEWFELKGVSVLEPISTAEPVRSVRKQTKRRNDGDNNEEEDEENNADYNNDEDEEEEEGEEGEEEEEDRASEVGSRSMSTQGRLPKRSPFVIRPLVAPLASAFSSSSSTSSFSSTLPTPLPPFTPLTVNPTLMPSSSFSSSSFSSSSTPQYTINPPPPSIMTNNARGEQQPTQTPSQDSHPSSSSSTYSTTSKYRSMLQVLPKQGEQSIVITEEFKVRLRRSAEVIFGPPLSFLALSKSSLENPSLHKLEVLAEALLEHRKFAIPCSGVTGGESPRAGFVTAEGTKRALMAVWKKRHVGAAGSRRAAEDSAKFLSNSIFQIVAKNQNKSRSSGESPLTSSSRIDSILSAFAPLLRNPGQAVTKDEIILLSSFSSAVSSSLCQQADATSSEKYFLKPLLRTHLTVDVGDGAAATDVDHLAHTFVGILG